MTERQFDFWTAVLGEEGAREHAQHFLGMPPDVRAELFPDRDPVELAATLRARAAAPRPTRQSEVLSAGPTASPPAPVGGLAIAVSELIRWVSRAMTRRPIVAATDDAPAAPPPRFTPYLATTNETPTVVARNGQLREAKAEVRRASPTVSLDVELPAHEIAIQDYFRERLAEAERAKRQEERPPPELKRTGSRHASRPTSRPLRGRPPSPAPTET